MPTVAPVPHSGPLPGFSLPELGFTTAHAAHATAHGIPLASAWSPANDGAAGLAVLRNYVAELPAGVTDVVKGFQYADSGPGDPRTGMTVGEADPVTKTAIVLNAGRIPPAQVIMTLDHEMGHLLDFANDIPGSPTRPTFVRMEDADRVLPGSWDSVAESDQQKNGVFIPRGIQWSPDVASDSIGTPLLGRRSVTQYGSTNPQEDIAESVALLRFSNRTGSLGSWSDASGVHPVRFQDLYPGRTAALLAGPKTAAFVQHPG